MRFRTRLTQIRLTTAALLVTLPALAQTTANVPSKSPVTAPNREWPAYGGNPEGTRYSPLKQINRSNVGRLRVAWTYEAPGVGLQSWTAPAGAEPVGEGFGLLLFE